MNLHLDRLATPPKTVDTPEHRVHVRSEEEWFSLDNLVSGKLKAATPEERHQLHRVGAPAQMMMFKNVPDDAGYIAGVIEVSEKTEPRSHSGSEFICVLHGQAVVTVEEQDFMLELGEAITILPFESHSYGPAPEQTHPVSLLCFRVG